MKKKIFFTDIDGTFINEKYYAGNNFDNVKELIKNDFLAVLVSSRALAELKYFCKTGKIDCCLIGENGGFIYIPDKIKDRFKLSNETKYIALGVNREKFKNQFIELKNKFEKYLIAIDDLTLDEYAEIAGYSIEDAKRSRNREYSYLFKFTGEKSDLKKIDKFCKIHNLTLQFGGKWLALSAGLNKGAAIKKFKKISGANISFGIGNSSNDFDLLNNVDYPFAIINENKKICEELLKIKNVININIPAPAGWQQFKNVLLKRIHSQKIFKNSKKKFRKTL